MIPLVDLQAQCASITDEIDTAVLRVVANGQFALGPEVAAFEEEFAAYCGVDHGIAINAGTSAQQPAYIDLGRQVGDHPYAEAAAAATLTLSVYPELPAETPARIAEIVRRALQA